MKVTILLVASFLIFIGSSPASVTAAARMPLALTQSAAEDTFETGGVGRDVRSLTPFNFFAFTVQQMIARGVPATTIALLLMLPIIATLVAVTRQIIGLRTLGIYTPSIVTLAFLDTGLTLGLVIFLVVLAVATGVRILLKRLRILYLPRMALTISIVSLVLLTLLGVSAWFGNAAIASISIFPLLIIVALAEKFVGIEIEEGLVPAITLALETMMIAIVGFSLLSSAAVRHTVLVYPEITLLAIVANLLLGRWSGLRILEYVRFRHVIAAMREQTKEAR
ncbi:MAG: hypothetical protein HY459_04100 [Parcubacteria group bacterium]|nr:hypothetical protein [Parcubacteria group bacterium]